MLIQNQFICTIVYSLAYIWYNLRMFTGIIEELGKIRQITTNKIQIECSTLLSDLKIGDSVAVDGVCLTVTDIENNSFDADISPETMKVTILGNLKSGDLVNLERALPADGRFGGHIVTGHIDGQGKCTSFAKTGEFYCLEVSLPNECSKYVVQKGSVTINGISLTVANIIQCAIIPHTFENTNLKMLKSGDFVNIEVDILAKYIEKFLSTSDNRSRIDYDFLRENGFANI